MTGGNPARTGRRSTVKEHYYWEPYPITVEEQRALISSPPCSGLEATIFIDNEIPAGRTPAQHRLEQKRAHSTMSKVCQSCPVKRLCAREALALLYEGYMPTGWWGGVQLRSKTLTKISSRGDRVFNALVDTAEQRPGRSTDGSDHPVRQ